MELRKLSRDARAPLPALAALLFTFVVSAADAQTYTLTVKNGTGGGSYKAGTKVSISANPPAVGYVFADWTGATVANPKVADTTLQMPSANGTVTATYSLNPNIPFPVKTHPRLWVTGADVTKLQGWANTKNPTYAGMSQVLSKVITDYNTQFFPGGKPNPDYPDPGDTQGYTGLLTEQYGLVLAFNSLIDPSATKRIAYAQDARNLLMYAMDLAALGPLANEPFRDPAFPIYNRANATGEDWPLIVDWIYSAKDAAGNPILTAADKATIRKVFLLWATECLNASTTGGDHPTPIGTTNSLSLLPGHLPYRMASNNYYLGHARLLTMMALSFDPSDDPPVNAKESVAVLGNSIRSYILNATGAWLYQTYAMMGEAANVVKQYGIPGTGAGFGLASGGLPPEGLLYGHSFGFLLGQLLALKTAGYDVVAYGGPQVQLIGAPVWGRFVDGLLSELTPMPSVPPSETYLGPVYGFASYGDLLRLYVTPDFMQPFALLSLLEQKQGQTTHLNAARWFGENAVQGTLANNISNPWTWGVEQTILYFMLLDPAAAKPTDPRPALPVTFVDPGAARIAAHSDWTDNNRMFSYRASWESINHQNGDAGQFEFFRDGEWLTKAMTNYDNNGVGFTTYFHNTLGLKNWCPNGTPNLNWFEAGEWANGSQWILGLNAGDPVTHTSSGPGYVYADTDMTKLYNRPDVWDADDASMDITQATRSIVWLKDDTIVVYDRASSKHTGLFKTFNLSLIANPELNGNVATETMKDGQQLFVQALLPQKPSMSAVYAASQLNPIADLEPSQYVLTIQDPTMPATTRFLNVLEGANAGEKMTKAAYITNAKGTEFEGAQIGSTAVYFTYSSSTSIAKTTFDLPTGVKTVVFAGLAPGASYGVGVVTTSGTTTLTLTPGGTGFVADSAGLLKVAA